ncbi:hypothetical protein GCM10022221_69350 [Actinocorallia aurea]
MTHLLTGATGFVGAAMALELLDRTPDDLRCLVRGPDAATATLRLHNALSHAARLYGRADLIPAIAGRTRAVAGDVTEPGCGVAPSALPPVTAVWHAAASLRFEDRYAAEIHTMNVVGAGNVVDLAKALGGPPLNHVSTAYVAGARTGTVTETVADPAVRTHNHYERTKIEGELIVARSGLDWRILRPSIVIGHSRTLAVTSYSGMYGFLSALLVFRRTVERNFGHLLRFKAIPLIADPDAPLDFVPVDLVARDSVTVGLHGPSETVYHLTNPAAPFVGGAIAELFESTGLRPPRYVTGDGQFTSMDRELDDALEFYSSYLAYAKTFDRANTDAAVAAAGVRTDAEFPMPPGTVRRFADWYLELIRADGRVSAPARQLFAYRKGRR